MLGTAMERVSAFAGKMGIGSPQGTSRRLPGARPEQRAQRDESPLRKAEREARAQERQEALAHYRGLGQEKWMEMSPKDLGSNIRDYRRVLLEEAYDQHVLKADRTTEEGRGKFNLLDNLRRVNINPEKYPPLGKHSIAASKQMASLTLFDKKDGDLMYNLTTLSEMRAKESRRNAQISGQR